MFRSDTPTNYEEVYQGLVSRLAQADLTHARRELGAREAGDCVAVEVFGRTCLVGPEGVLAADRGPLDFTVRIVLAYYVLQAGSGELANKWVSYRDFKDGAFFYPSFARIVENKIAQDFSGRLASLEKSAIRLGGRPLDEGLGGDLCCRFQALPRLPLALIFYDADDDFPASARILYDASAPVFLDMECLAVVGLIAADQLTLSGKEARPLQNE